MPNYTILAIETSCDDTCAAICQDFRILSNVIVSQDHALYGGVFPTHAKQQHRLNLPRVVNQAIAEANVGWSDLDFLAVTQGPGLAPSLEQGIAYAKQLAQKNNLPLIPVNHLEGHVLSVLAEPNTLGEPKFPALAMVISGGHTDFILVHDFGQYQRLGWSIDDAAGEALDKFGREIGLDYPAGAAIEKLANSGIANSFDFPLPMTASGDFNLSFAGLKTAGKNMVKQACQDYHVVEGKELPTQVKANLAASFQRAVFRHIEHKLLKVISKYSNLKELWVGGGVAANTSLRQTLHTAAPHLTFRYPPSRTLCRDNAGMIGLAAQLHTYQAVEPEQVSKIERIPSWSLGISSW